jgi:hypothetical protein
MFSGPPGTVSHVYPVEDANFPIEVSVTDQTGTYLSAITSMTGALASAQQAYVAKLYLDLLGRSADATGLNGFVSELMSGTPAATVAQQITSSQEYAQHVINGLFEKYLGRPVDATGLAAWLPVFKQGGVDAVAAGILGSTEFYQNAGGTALGYVQALYQVILGRSMDPAGMNFVNMINFGVSRTQVALEVLKSPEAAQDTVTQWYVQYLGRTPGPTDNVAGWETQVMADPTAALVQFVSTSEFQQKVSTTTPVA